jgi:integrase
MKIRLTKKLVESTKPGIRDTYLWDTEARGLGLKVTPAGQRIFVQAYRIHGGKRGWITYGRLAEVTLEEARSRAVEARRQIAAGIDPSRDRNASDEPTVDMLGDRYLVEYAGPHKKPRSCEEDARNFAKHVRPAIGRLKVADVERQDILKLHHKLRGTPSAANRVLALLSKMFSLAEEWGLRPESSNPCRRVRKYKEQARERFLSADELQRLGAALGEAIRKGEHPAEIAIIKTLLLTGARLNEIATLKWAYVDFERGSARLPDSKTGAKTLRLGAPVLDLLAELPRTCDFVFPDDRGRPLYRSRIERVWWKIRASAGLDDVRLHDCRHTFASWAAMGGASLPMLGALLGHRQAATTAKYSHLRDDPVHAVAEAVSSTLTAALAGQSGEVVPLSGARRSR